MESGRCPVSMPSIPTSFARRVRSTGSITCRRIPTLACSAATPTGVHKVHLHAHRGKGAGVFAADHTGADHHEALRQRLNPQELVGVMHALVLGRKLRGPPRG